MANTITLKSKTYSLDNPDSAYALYMALMPCINAAIRWAINTYGRRPDTDAEDLRQGAWEALMDAAENYDCTKADFATWFDRKFHIFLMDSYGLGHSSQGKDAAYHTDCSLDQTIDNDSNVSIGETIADPKTIAEAESKIYTEQVIANIADPYLRRIFYQRYITGLTVEEIAEKHGKKKKEVNADLKLARKIIILHLNK